MTKKAQVPLSREQTELEAARSDYKLAAEYLDKHPHLVNRFGTLAGRAKAAWQCFATDGDKLEIEAIDRNLAELRRCSARRPQSLNSFGRPGSRSVGCKFTRSTYAKPWWRAVTGSCGAGIETTGRAHRRYLSALKALSDIRRMQTPAVQVNIAQRQVNVGTVSQPTRNLAAEASTVETKP